MQALFVALVTGADGRWHPGIGDPTIMGWVTVVAYALATYFGFQALRASELCQSFIESALAEPQHAAGVFEHDLGPRVRSRA